MKIKVGVLFGGVSVEHEVSIISAVQAMQNMDKNKYEIVPIYMAKDRTWYTGKMLLEIDIYKDFEDLKRYATKVVLVNKEGRFCLQSTGLFKRIVEEIDIAFPIVHGAGVEDGTIQGYLATIGVPVVGSSVLGSALGQDKVIMKQIFESVGIPIVPYLWFFDDEYLNNAEEITKQVKKLGYPVIVKPASLGSSVGITVIKKEEDLEVGIMDAITYDSKIVVEKMVDNLVEVNCSVLGDYKFQQTSVLEEVMSTEEFLTYNDKYLSGTKGKKGSPSKGMASTDRIIPARLSTEMREEIEELSKKVFKTLNLSGICRIDYLIDKKKEKIYVNEPNTIPGSLSFYLWQPIDKQYNELLDEAINIAIRDYKSKSKKVYSFDTNILSGYNGLKGTKGIKNKIK
ncbi:MAG: D-alanine--D-alanine ligase [Bacilli bacterium]|nr:D-alanine--D-alanine ligase [Bacilli bacterium]